MSDLIEIFRPFLGDKLMGLGRLQLKSLDHVKSGIKIQALTRRGRAVEVTFPVVLGYLVIDEQYRSASLGTLVSQGDESHSIFCVENSALKGWLSGEIGVARASSVLHTVVLTTELWIDVLSDTAPTVCEIDPTW